MTDATKPLAGTRVIDLTTNMSGPLATIVLADQGADVVKVEPLSGDAIRTVGTGHDRMSAYFANNNRKHAGWRAGWPQRCSSPTCPRRSSSRRTGGAATGPHERSRSSDWCSWDGKFPW
jgi:hypothetical protein